MSYPFTQRYFLSVKGLAGTLDKFVDKKGLTNTIKQDKMVKRILTTHRSQEGQNLYFNCKYDSNFVCESFSKEKCRFTDMKEELISVVH